MSEKKDNDSHSYENKTERINAWGNIGKIFVKLIWAFVILIILASVGKIFLVNKSQEETTSSHVPKSKPIKQSADWNSVDEAIVRALKLASKEAKISASDELDIWVSRQMERVDNDFLDWYFGYWNQQAMGLESLWHGVKHWAKEDNLSASEAITEKVQEEFAKRVLRPQISQMALERITREVVNQYTVFLRTNLQRIPGNYDIPQSDWERHLNGIAVMTTDVEGNRNVEVSLKALTTSTAVGTVVLAKAMAPAMKSIGTKVSTNLAGKAAAKMASKTGAKVASKAGGKFLGPIVGIGIIIWDAWDHNSTKRKNKPILRENIQDYFDGVKDMLLNDTESGVMSVIYRVEGEVVKAL